MVYAILLLVIIFAILGLSLMLYALLGKGPRFRRGLKQVEHYLDSGDWEQSLQMLDVLELQTGLTPTSPIPETPRKQEWLREIQRISEKANHMAAGEALGKGRFQDALAYWRRVSSIQSKPESEAQNKVLEAMLVEVRRLFASTEDGVTSSSLQSLLEESHKIQPSSPEVSFWKALCLIREHQLESALEILLTVHDQVGKINLDAALYAGGILHRLGRPQEAVRYLADANRVSPNCFLVPWQMGLALVASNGDSSIAIRALQRALSPRGLPTYLASPNQLWIETFPEKNSFLRKLASKYPYRCPLFGQDLPVILRQGQLGLAQAFYRQGNYQESADLYLKLIGDSPPNLVLLRGVGLSLARLGKYDQAYKHLRAALDSDDNNEDALTAGYLALCGAMGKPSNPSDKPKNIIWAIRLLNRYSMPGNTEWATLYNNVFQEARSNEILLPEEDQVELCNVLASVNAVDTQAAAGYSQLAEAYPNRISLRHAWLYCQAATLHDLAGKVDLSLFARMFQEESKSRDFFQRQQWDFDSVRYSYLKRCAILDPGHFPDSMGIDYARQGEQFLLHRSHQEELVGRTTAAVDAVNTLINLSPYCVGALDRLACLSYRQGDMTASVERLHQWHQLSPNDHWPLVRHSIIEQERGNHTQRHELIQKALCLVTGETQAEIAYLGARLALRTVVKAWKEHRENALVLANESLEQTQLLLETCLAQHPGHINALWVLAAVYSIRGYQEQLIGLAPRFDRPEIQNPQFQFLGAVCNLACNDFGRVTACCQRAATDPTLALEIHYLLAWAHLQRNDQEQASTEFKQVASQEASPSAPLARGHLGKISFTREAYKEAIGWWTQINPRTRSTWKLDEPLQQTVLLTGLRAMVNGRFETAAQRFEEAAKNGLRDRRLALLLSLALMKAGQRLLLTQA